MPGSAAGRGRNPWHLTPLELLLQGHPGEFLMDSPQAAAHEPSDLALMRRAAERWASRAVLTDEERERITAVWLEGEYRAPHNMDTARRDELRALSTAREV